jgi:hypothetical protein
LRNDPVTSDDPINVAEQLILEGAGTYAGLTAYISIDGDEATLLGAIIPDEMSELPADRMDIHRSWADEAQDDG